MLENGTHLPRRLERQAHWTDALAVGSQAFVTFAESLHQNRRRLERWPVDPDAGKTTWHSVIPEVAFMYRFAQEQVERWVAARRRKPLIVRGARQVGKTWLVEHVATAAFETVVKIPARMWCD